MAESAFNIESVIESIRSLFGVSYTPEQMRNPDWCVKEVGRLGYGSSLTRLRVQDLTMAFEILGRSAPEAVREITDNGGAFAFTLFRANAQPLRLAPELALTLEEATAVMVERAVEQVVEAVEQVVEHGDTSLLKEPPFEVPPSAPLEHWTGVADQIFERSKGRVRYSGEQVADPQWCLNEMARLGYSCSVSLTTPAMLIARRRANGVYREDEDMRKLLLDLQKNGGFYHYQLLGHQYETRGAHGSPSMSAFSEATGVALFNVVGLHPTLDAYL